MLLAEYEAALNKILKTNSIEKAKTFASDALGVDVEDFVEEEDYLDDPRDIAEAMDGY
jgi:hypothetical protein